MRTPLKALLVEDNPLDAELIVKELGKAGFEVMWERVETAEDYHARLLDEPDLVLCDFDLPQFSGLAALEILREVGLGIPFLLVSGTIGEDTAVEAMRHGAMDYLLKDRLGRLGAAVKRALEQGQAHKARRRAEEALRLSEERFRELTEHIREVFWMTDPAKNQILYISPAYEQIWGRSSDSLYSNPRSWLDAIHEADRARVRSVMTRQAAGTYDEEYRIVRPDGSIRWIHDRAFPVKNAEGEVLRVVGVASDVTKQKTLEDQVLQAQKMEAIGQLAGGVAHDFNNLLTVILGNSEVVLMEQDHTPSVKEGLLQIRMAAERAASLTRQLLVFSRRETLQLRDIDLSGVVTDMSRMLARVLGEDVSLRVHLSPGVVAIHADPGMIEQILMNLAVNARDAMPRGGELFIQTSIVEAIEPAAPDAVSRSFARLVVKDSGSGIPEEIRPRIFEPFFTTKPVGKGTGLGLATVYSIVQQHKGWIELDSGVGRGTAFTIHFPRALGAAPNAAKDSGTELPKGNGQMILLVEDDPALRKLTARMLTRFGYNVMQATSGVDAVKVWRDHRSKRGSPGHPEIQLVLTDLVMPEGMTGMELATLLLSDDPQLKVVYMSGYSAEIAGTELSMEEGKNFLAKPFGPKKLAEVVHLCLSAGLTA